MARDFPDSIDGKILLSEAYGKVGRSGEALAIIELLIKVHPDNLLAWKAAADQPSK